MEKEDEKDFVVKGKIYYCPKHTDNMLLPDDDKFYGFCGIDCQWYVLDSVQKVIYVNATS